MSSNIPTADSNSILSNNNLSTANTVQSQIPISPNNLTQTASQSLNPFLAAAAQAAKGFSHPFHQLNNRLLNVQPFLPPNSLPSSSSNQLNSNNLLTATNKPTSSNNNNSMNIIRSNKETNDNMTNLKETLNSNANLHLHPFLRSLSAANPLLHQSNFPMLPQLLQQHQLFSDKLDAAMLNQSANQINHSINSNSSLISNSSTSSSPVPFNNSTNKSINYKLNKNLDKKMNCNRLMTTSNLLNKLNDAELNHSLNINVEDDDDWEMIENDVESVDDLELDVDCDQDFDKSIENNESCLSNEDVYERTASSKSMVNKEQNKDQDMRNDTIDSPKIKPITNLPDSLNTGLNNNSKTNNLSKNQITTNNSSSKPSKPIAVHPLKNFPSVSVVDSTSLIHNFTNSLTNTQIPNQHRILSIPSSSTTNSPFYNAASFLQQHHPLIPSTDRNSLNPNSFCHTNPWLFPFDTNTSSSTLEAVKLNLASFFNNNKQEAK